MQATWIPLTEQKPEPGVKVLAYSTAWREPVVVCWYFFLGEETWKEADGVMDPPEFWLPIPTLPR